MQKTRQKLVCRKNLRTPSPSKHPRLLPIPPRNPLLPALSSVFPSNFSNRFNPLHVGKAEFILPRRSFHICLAFPPLSPPVPAVPRGPGCAGAGAGGAARTRTRAPGRAGDRCGGSGWPRGQRSLRSCSPRSAPARRGSGEEMLSAV